jgi:predicted TIM-barrel fold metal-dependent hydrolase
MPYGGNDWLALTQEPVLEPELPICDPHHHFWDFRTGRIPRFGFDWHLRDQPVGSEELAAQIAPLMSYCIEQFGPDRCMFESNFPVDKVSFSYPVLFNAFKRFSKGYSALERAALFHDTATRAYRIALG